MESNSKYKILIRDKKGCFIISPFINKTKKEFELQSSSNIIMGKKYFANIDAGNLSIFSIKDDYKLIKNFNDLKSVSMINFSENEKFLTIIQKPTVDNNNLKIFSIDNNNFDLKFQISSKVHPNSLWPQIIHDLKDENKFFYLNKSTIEIYSLNNNNLINKLENILSFVQTTIEDKNYLLCCKIIYKDSNKKNCFFSVYDYNNNNNFDKPLKEQVLSLTDRVLLKLSPDKKVLLIHSINDNTSNKSYYGQSSLYYFNISNFEFKKFTLPEGPIHDFCWNFNSENFIVTAGHLPSKTIYYDKNMNLIKEICIGKFNKIFISPNSKILALCGFGSLNGDINFYELNEKNDFRLIGKYNLFCCVDLFWSFDSKFLVGSVLSTRVKVDNEYRIMKYNGTEEIIDKNVGEIYQCLWVSDNENENNDFEIEVNEKSLEEKKKEGVKLKTLGTIDFGVNNRTNRDEEIERRNESVGIGFKKKKKKKKKKGDGNKNENENDE
jgi:translation initiation factor 2A